MTLHGNRRRKAAWPPPDFSQAPNSPETPTHADGSPDYLAGALADSPVLHLLEEGREKHAVGPREPTKEDGDCLQCSTCSGACDQLRLNLTRVNQAAQTRNNGKEFP